MTVVVPALNAAATLAAQLRALERQTYDGRFDVIVVDNGSIDGTVDVARAFRSSPRFGLRVVFEDRRGVNWARNAGIGAAPDGIVLLCDADDEVDPGWIRALTGAMSDGTWVGGALDYTKLNLPRTREVWNMPARSHYGPSDPYVDQTFGGNCGFFRSMWDEVGGFDATLSGTGGDENEMFMRAYGAGYRYRDVPDAIVSYRLRPGLFDMARQRYRQGRNQVRMSRRAGGRLLPEGPTLRETLGALAWRLAAMPKHLGTRQRRAAWIAGVSRHTGQLVALCLPERARSAGSQGGSISAARTS